jgi:hypothetical protein
MRVTTVESIGRRGGPAGRAPHTGPPPRGNPSVDLEEVRRALSRLERVVGN